MKIGIDIRLIGRKRTGDEVVFFNLVKNIALIDSENEYFLFTDVVNLISLEKIAKDLGIICRDNFKIISLETPNRFFWNFWTLPLYLRKNPVDVYHTQYITPWFVSRKIKIFTIIHDISFNFFPQFIKFSDLFFLRALIPLSLKRADKIIAVSEFTKREIVRFYKIDPEKINCVYNAVSDDFLYKNYSALELENIRKKYALPEKFALYVGTLQPRKNIPFLIEAFAKLQLKLPDVGLVIAGNKKAHNFDENIDAAINQNNAQSQVVFPGFIDEEDKVAVFRLADVFVFPSLYEGFGIPVLEAMSQGVPVIASDIESLKEVAKDCALYFDVKSVDDLTEKMYNIFVDKEISEGLIDCGKRRISFFSWKKSAQNILALYENLFHN